MLERIYVEETVGDASVAPEPAVEKRPDLEAAIGYSFRDPLLLRRALTHRSYANEQPEPRPQHNEALEFLGDAVLEFLISAWLLERHPFESEGTLSKLRASTVSAPTLQKLAALHELGEHLLLNRGEEKTGGRRKSALQVNAYEALLAAIYLDGGIDAAREFVRREFATILEDLDPRDLTAADFKTALQERLQANGLPAPRYNIIESAGPDHQRIFRVEVTVSGQTLAAGMGRTIKSAHQEAASVAFANLEELLERLKPPQS